MSKGITIQEFDAFLDKVVQKILAIAKMPFPKADEVTRIPVLDSVPGWSNDLQVCVGASMDSDYALGTPTLDMMADIEPLSSLDREIPVDVETFTPMGFPMQTPKERTSRRPAAAVTHNKVPELPLLSQVPAKEEPIKKSLDAKGLENLLAAFKESGMGVREVKSLPSGATRITFDEFFGARQGRQPEVVRVRGRG